MTQHTMTRDAGAISIRAYEHATRLGHPYLGGEHYLLALAAADQPAGTVLREQGVTPGRVEAEIVRLSGAGLFDLCPGEGCGCHQMALMNLIQLTIVSLRRKNGPEIRGLELRSPRDDLDLASVGIVKSTPRGRPSRSNAA
jgi:hypothetical protein